MTKNEAKKETFKIQLWRKWLDLLINGRKNLKRRPLSIFWISDV
jgi:hypothetical protein